jgi:capsid assembly protease
MRRNAVIFEVMSVPWAIERRCLDAFVTILDRWAEGEPMPAQLAEQIAQDKQARDTRRSNAMQASNGGIAVLPMYGVLSQRGNMVEDISGPGSTSTQAFGRMLSDALADEGVGQILIDVDSPGGSVYGIAELAAQVRAARGSKPIVAVANSLAASAAYWLASQASELYVTPGGEVGSIGVFTTHTDRSEALKQQGLKTTLISAGKYKVEGNPFGPLDEEARAHLQGRADEVYATFTADIAKGRGVPIAQVRDDMGQGRLVGADAAYKASMVDGIATLDEVLQRMKKTARSATKPGAPVSQLAHAQRRLQTVG